MHCPWAWNLFALVNDRLGAQRKTPARPKSSLVRVSSRLPWLGEAARTKGSACIFGAFFKLHYLIVCGASVPFLCTSRAKEGHSEIKLTGGLRLSPSWVLDKYLALLLPLTFYGSEFREASLR